MLVDPKMVVAVADITPVSKAERREVREEEQTSFVLFIRRAQAFLTSAPFSLSGTHMATWSYMEAGEISSFLSLHSRGEQERRNLRMDGRFASRQCLHKSLLERLRFQSVVEHPSIALCSESCFQWGKIPR